jgi:hypothetical protein
MARTGLVCALFPVALVVAGVPLSALAQEDDARAAVAPEPPPGEPLGLGLGTTTGLVVPRLAFEWLPLGRDFESVAALVPGTLLDPYGTGISGAPSVENTYFLDGINVTSVHMSQAARRASGSALHLDFLDAVSITTGGFGAEQAGGTGGIISAVTRSGTNELTGGVALYYEPGALRGRAPRVPVVGQAISSETLPDYSLDVFADVSGALVRDHLFFYVGVNPTVTSITTRRTVSAIVDNCTQTDPNRAGPCVGGSPAQGDGYQDFSAASGQFATRALYASDLGGGATELQWLAKLDLRLSPDHGLALSYFGAPRSEESHRVLGEDLLMRTLLGSQDASARWVSRFFDRSWQLEAQLSYHRERNEHGQGSPRETQRAVTWWTDPQGGGEPQAPRTGSAPSLSWFANEGSGDAQALALCDAIDRTGSHPRDPASKLHVACPVPGYVTGGAGFWENLVADRLGVRVMGTHRLRWLGEHELIYGWDYEDKSLRDTQVDTAGGTVDIVGFGAQVVAEKRSFYPAGPVDRSQCDAGDGLPADASLFCAMSRTESHALFLRDDWRVLPNLSLNVGARWERQALRGAADYEESITGDPALLIENLAPRLGVAFDPTGQGRSRLFGSYGRSLESIPLDLNNRALTRQGTETTLYQGNQGCLQGLIGKDMTCQPIGTAVYGGTKTLAPPGLSGMTQDEIILGGEYELGRGIRSRGRWIGGLVYTHRTLGSALEDVSFDRGGTYTFANPGSPAQPSQLDALRARASAAQTAASQAMAAGNMQLGDEYHALASQLASAADSLPLAATLPAPKRDYNALTLSVRRSSPRTLVQASYTYARTIGNYPGLYDGVTGQLDPNISQLYDLPETMQGREGPLPTDAPHQLKLDGAYAFSLGEKGRLILGGALSARSGAPRYVLAMNQTFGDAENFLLPAGSGGRNDVVLSVDLQMTYTRRLAARAELQVFLAVFNATASEAVTSRDDVYTKDFAQPVVGGNMKDLAHLKNTEGLVAKPSETYGLPTAYQAPLATRLGLRLNF